MIAHKTKHLNGSKKMELILLKIAALVGAVDVSLLQFESKAVLSILSSSLFVIYCLESSLSSKTRACLLVDWFSAPIPPRGFPCSDFLTGIILSEFAPVGRVDSLCYRTVQAVNVNYLSESKR